MKSNVFIALALLLCAPLSGLSQEAPHDGLTNNLSNLYRISNAKTRSISPEKGHYVGTYMAWGVNSNGWWGEGEIKFYLDGDRDFPTINGTGTEDYFGGSYNFENKR